MPTDLGQKHTGRDSDSETFLRDTGGNFIGTVITIASLSIPKMCAFLRSPYYQPCIFTRLTPYRKSLPSLETHQARINAIYITVVLEAVRSEFAVRE